MKSLVTFRCIRLKELKLTVIIKTSVLLQVVKVTSVNLVDLLRQMSLDPVQVENPDHEDVQDDRGLQEPVDCQVRPELEMDWIHPWIGLGWVT